VRAFSNRSLAISYAMRRGLKPTSLCRPERSTTL
jgi:hypothetical protein